MTVLDASAVVALILRTSGSSEIASRLRNGDRDLHAPHLLDIEVTQVLRRFFLVGDVDEARALEALADLAELPLIRHPHLPFCPRIWDLRHNLTAYDATYVALSEALDASLMTCDRRLATTAQHLVRVEVFG